MSELTITTPQGEIAVTDTGGEGLPVLLLHGSGASREIFSKQLEGPLGQHHRLVALDLPGHGKSADAPVAEATYTISGLAGVVDAVMERMGIFRAAVYGWSLGGHIAIEMLAARKRVAGVMLTGAPPVGRGSIAMLRGFQMRWDMLLASKETFSRRDAERYARLCYGEDAEPWMIEAILRTDGRIRPTVMKSMMRGEGADQKLAVETAEVLVAMVNGANEPIARLGYLESLSYRQLWEERCHVIPGAGHAPFLQTPQMFNALLHRFAEDVKLREAKRGTEAPAEVAGAAVKSA